MTSENIHQDNVAATMKILKPTQGKLFTEEESIGFLNPITNIEEKISRLKLAAKRRRYTYTSAEASQELEISTKALLHYVKAGMLRKCMKDGSISFYYLDLVKFLKAYPTTNNSPDE